MVSPPNDKDDDFLRLADEFFIYSQVVKELEEEGIWERTADNTSSGRKCRDKMTEAEKVKMAEARKRWEEATPEEKREFKKYIGICIFILFAIFAGVFVLIVWLFHS